MNDRQERVHRVAFLLILLIFCGGKLSPASVGREKPDCKFTFELCEVAMVSVFKEVEKASDYVFAWPADVSADIHKPVSVRVKGAPLSVVMECILHGSGLTYRVLDRQVVVFRASAVQGRSWHSVRLCGEFSNPLLSRHIQFQ